MMKFKDLKFEKTYNGVGAHHKFDNGITISVQAGENIYSTPRENLTSPNSYSSFEVALWDESGEWVTQYFVKTDDVHYLPDDVVAGWVNRVEIDAIMMAVQSK